CLVRAGMLGPPARIEDVADRFAGPAIAQQRDERVRMLGPTAVDEKQPVVRCEDSDVAARAPYDCDALAELDQLEGPRLRLRERPYGRQREPRRGRADQ